MPRTCALDIENAVSCPFQLLTASRYPNRSIDPIPKSPSPPRLLRSISDVPSVVQYSGVEHKVLELNPESNLICQPSFLSHVSVHSCWTKTCCRAASLPRLRSLTTLVLSSHSLSGRIPPQLGNCSSLVQLWVDLDTLTGDIPESLGNLKSLPSFNLSTSLFTGEVPLTLQPSFGSMTNLSGVDICYNYLSCSEPPLVYKNTALTYYDASSNNFSGYITSALDDMSKLPAIKCIALKANSFTGTVPPSIGDATTLSRLSPESSEGMGQSLWRSWRQASKGDKQIS